MGFKVKLFALVAGLALFSLGAWPVGAVCFAYLLLSSRHRARGGSSAPRHPLRVPWRYLLAAVLGLLSVVALGSGGTYSPLAFASAAVGIVVLPRFSSGRLSSVEPIAGTILLRSRYLPIRWHALAEVKPGAEDPPRSLASYSGDLLVFLQSGKIYSVSSGYASGRKAAETVLLRSLRSTSSPRMLAASLLPLDSTSSAELLSHHTTAVRIGPGDLVDVAPSLSGVVSVKSDHGRIQALSVYSESAQAGSAAVPAAKEEADGAPLLWEFLEAVGKRVDWPAPDSLSGILESVRATRGEPMGDRIAEMEAAGPNVRIRSLGGETAELSRVQLRAIVSIYS